MKLDYFLTPYTKISSIWIKEFNLRLETIKLLEENIGSKLFDIHLSNFFFFDLSPQERETKVKINKWDYMRLISFCTVKETINKTKRQSTECEKIFANHIANREFKTKIYKELIQLSVKKHTTNSNMD